MNPQVPDSGKRLHFGSSNQAPLFRHPYEKYNSKISNENAYRVGDDREIVNKNNESSEPKLKKPVKTDGQNSKKGLEERNNLICQTFLTENPFFGAYYPALRPRSIDGEGGSCRGSEKTRSFTTDFDDSKTYKVVYCGDSGCNDDHDSLHGCKYKKADDIHHFHEHHHFFHDKKDEKSGKNFYDKYQYGVAKEPTTFPDPYKSFLKQPIQESCMIYQMQEEKARRPGSREARKDKSKDGSKHMSRSSSKSGKKSSDNETYTVVCEHCQKLLKEYPNARIVGHENVPTRFSSESCDRKTYVQYGYNRDTVQEGWKPANTFVAEPHYQIHRLSMSLDGSKHKKRDKVNGSLDKVSTEKSERTRKSSRSLAKSRSAYQKKKKNKDGIDKKSGLKAEGVDVDSRLLVFTCENCKSVIEKYPEVSKGSEESGSDEGSDGKANDLNEGSLKSQRTGSVMTKPSDLLSDKKSLSYRSYKPSKTTDLGSRKGSSQHPSSIKVMNSAQKLPKAASVTEKKRSSIQKPSRSSAIMERRRSSSYNASRDPSLMERKKISSFKERRASSEMGKRVISSHKTSREAGGTSKKTSSLNEDSKVSSESKKKSFLPKASKESTERRSICSKMTTTSSKEPVKPSKKSSSNYKGYSMDKRVSSSRKPSRDTDISSRKISKTDSDSQKSAEKSKSIQTEERSIQTILGKLEVEDDAPTQRRSSTASKMISRNGISESKRSGTAPGGLVSSRSTNTYVKSSAVRGSATLSRRTVATKKSPLIQVGYMPEVTPNYGKNGIQTEITDLKSQLDRLEALHNLKVEAPEAQESRETAECQKHPIVVCTSTTYIMTKCGDDCGDRKGPISSVKIPPKPRAEELPRREEPRRSWEKSEEKSISKLKCCRNDHNCQVVGDKISKAISRVCHCPNKDSLGSYCGGGARARSCDRGNDNRRLFAKNQRTASSGEWIFRDDCNVKLRTPLDDSCPWRGRKQDFVVHVAESMQRRSVSNDIYGSQKLIAFGSFSRENLANSKRKTVKRSPKDVRLTDSPLQHLRGTVKLEDSARPGYVIRTSISDICEYKNGSTIRLMGKPGWLVCTKKLFLERSKKKGKNGTLYSGEFLVYPTGVLRSTRSKSIITLKKNVKSATDTEDSEFLYGAGLERQALSDSSLYIPLSIKSLDGRILIGKDEKLSKTSSNFPENVRFLNQGISNLHEEVLERKPRRSNLPDELYLLSSKSAGDRNATCSQDEQIRVTCDCRRERWTDQEENRRGKEKKVPVLFEELKTPRRNKDGRRLSDISLKCVYAERSGNPGFCNKVMWSTDMGSSKGKKKCVFGVSRCRRTRSRRQFSMNDKHRKFKWNRTGVSQKYKEDNNGTYNRPVGDSPGNKCACCNCSPNHTCSAQCEAEEEGVTGFRKILKDIGISGLGLGATKKPYCRPVYPRPAMSPHVGESFKSANTLDNYQTMDMELAGGELDYLDDEVKSVTDLKKACDKDHCGDRCCECVRQLEHLLTHVEFMRTSQAKQPFVQPTPPASPSPPHSPSHSDSREEVWRAETKKQSMSTSRTPPRINTEVLDDISLQRKRISECENMLRSFEMKLEDVIRQSEGNACKCDTTVKGCTCDENMRACNCDDTMKSCKCDENARVCNCDETMKGCSCDENMKGCDCEDTGKGCKCDENMKSCTCEGSTKGCKCDENMKSCTCEGSTKGCKCDEIMKSCNCEGSTKGCNCDETKKFCTCDEAMKSCACDGSIKGCNCKEGSEEKVRKSQKNIKSVSQHSPVPSPEVEIENVKLRDDGYIRFEGKILSSQLSPKRSAKTISCGNGGSECKRLSSSVQTVQKTSIVKNATQMTSEILIKEEEESGTSGTEHFLRETDMEEQYTETKNKEKETYAFHNFGSLPSKIEICSERMVCTCEKCCNIHYIDRHYLPTTYLRKWAKENRVEEEAEVSETTWSRREHYRGDDTKKETFRRRGIQDQGTSPAVPEKRDNYTEYRPTKIGGSTFRGEKDGFGRAGAIRTSEFTPRYRSSKNAYTSSMFTSEQGEGPLTVGKPTRYECIIPLGRPKDVGTSPIKKLGRDVCTSVMNRPVRDVSTSAVIRTKRDESVCTPVKQTRNEAITACRSVRNETTSANIRSRKDERQTEWKKDACRQYSEFVPSKPVCKAKEEGHPAKSRSRKDEAPQVKQKKCDSVETERSRMKKDDLECESEKFVNQSDLEKSPSEADLSWRETSKKSCVKPKPKEVICECDKTSTETEECEGHINCECAAKGIRCADKRKGKRFCNCGSKLRLIEDRLKALEERKRASESIVISPPTERKPMTEDSSLATLKEQEKSSESSFGYESPQKAMESTSSVSKMASSYEKTKRSDDGSSATSEVDRKITSGSSSYTESLENIESETDVEIKTKVITCNNLNFFDGGDPSVRTKCKCMEDSFCPFKYFQGQDMTATNNIFFVTNIELLRQWSGMYNSADYGYCKNYWNVNELKPVKLPRDWKTAVTSFFRSCKLRKKNIFKRRKKMSDAESSGNSLELRSSLSEGSFIDDCSRSSMPLKKRSFHVLAEGPRPTRPGIDRRGGRKSPDKKRKKRSRKKKIS